MINENGRREMVMAKHKKNTMEGFGKMGERGTRKETRREKERETLVLLLGQRETNG